MSLLSVENLSVHIGPAHILKGVNFSMERGDTLGFVGESGCGKSMTALAIMGLLSDQAQVSGRIIYDGQDLLALDDGAMCKIRGRRIAMIFQEPMTALNPVKTIGFQIAEGPRLHLGLGRAQAESRAISLLDRVGLPAPRFSPDLYPHQLSGGQRQRVVIAMTIACEPDILIADEPTTALDVTTQARILDLIADLVEQEGMALIMITHDLGVVAETTQNLAVMYAGSLVESGTTAEVYKFLAHPYTRGLFAAIPHLDSNVELAPGTLLPTIPGTVPLPTENLPGCAFADRCQRTQDQCSTTVPALQGTHQVACFNPWQAAP